MNRRLFLLASSLCIISTPALAKKKKNTQTVDAALSGTLSLKIKKHDGEADDYILNAKGKEYIISRTLHKKVLGSVGQQVTLYCTVMGGRKIIVINHIQK